MLLPTLHSPTRARTTPRPPPSPDRVSSARHLQPPKSAKPEIPPLPGGELHRDDPEPNTASATGDQRQDGIVIAEGLPQTHVAVAFATGMHAGQQRADGTPFILHPPEVATRLYLAGAPEHLIAAEYPTSPNVSASVLRQRFAPPYHRAGARRHRRRADRRLREPKGRAASPSIGRG
jgi:hypothetical protein